MFDYVIFSEVRGVLVSNGAPVVGAKIVRKYDWSWKNRKATDETVTNNNGEFSLPEITGFALLGWLPHEPYILQELTTTVEGKDFRLWTTDKRDYERNGELNGKPIKLYCSLQTEPKHTPTGNFAGNVFGICDLR